MKAFIIIMSRVVMGFGSAFVFLLPGVDNDTILTENEIINIILRKE